MGRKNANRGKRSNPTDFSHLITKVEEIAENEIKESKVKED